MHIPVPRRALALLGGLLLGTAACAGEAASASVAGVGDKVGIVYVAPWIASANATTFQTSIAGTFSILAGGFPPPSYSITGTPPAGVTIQQGTTGRLSGTPAPGTGGTYQFSFTAHNGVGSGATQAFTLTVNEPAGIVSPDVFIFTVKSPGSFNISATGWPASTFYRSGSPIQSGVTLAPDGTLSGTPQSGEVGTRYLTVVASNGVAPYATKVHTVVVAKANQAIAFGTAPVVSVGGTGTASATSSSGLAVTFSTNSATCSVVATSGGVTGISPGVCTIVANQAGDGDYNAAPPAQQDITVTAGDLDGDGIPDWVEPAEGRNPAAKDNDVFGNDRLFVMQQYRDFLGREGDPAGITGWTALVANGAYSRLQVIDAFLSSAEFTGLAAPVVRLYFATFQRIPEYPGLIFNTGLVRNGTVTVVQLADFFTVSPEFQATYGSLDDTQFVTLLYDNILGRAPDAAGLADWVSLLQSGHTRGQVLVGFSESPEFQASIANAVFTTMIYVGMLRRSPEPGGFAGWVSLLDAGTYTREQMINGFYLSTEYRGRFLP